GYREAEHICESGAVESRQQCSRHEWAELGRVGHVGEHLHHADQGADHAEGWRAIADRAIYLLTLVKMGEEVVAVPLEIVADEMGTVTVSDEAHALGEERVFYFDLFETDRPLFARDFGQPRQFFDQFALAHAPQGKGKFGTKRQTVENRGKREADQRGGEG